MFVNSSRPPHTTEISRNVKLERAMRVENSDRITMEFSHIYLPPANEVFIGVYLSTGEGVGFPACITCHMTRGVCPNALVGRPWGVWMQTPWMQTPLLHADPPGCRPEGVCLTPPQPLVEDPPGCRPLWMQTPWMQTPQMQTLLPWDTTGYRQQAGGMHPPGMHSCN